VQILKKCGWVDIMALAGSSARAGPPPTSIKAKPSPALAAHTLRKRRRTARLDLDGITISP
jgi:hypothetical protein